MTQPTSPAPSLDHDTHGLAGPAEQDGNVCSARKPPSSGPTLGSSNDAILERLTRLHPKAIDLTLGRTERLLGKLGNPHRKLAPVVHVAGTNGKGSLIAFLRAILEGAGYRVQAYTSPHLIAFAERIRLADGQIGDTELGRILAECERVNAGEPITYFEITTAAAFLAFSQEKADISLIEVGLGGRFDSTNVITTPRLTAITPISLDHQAFLGNTLAKIAREKAGIIKPGVPLVLAKQPRRVRETLLKHSQEIAAPIIAHAADRDADVGCTWRYLPGKVGFVLRVGADRVDLPPPALQGRHQQANAAQAAVCAKVLDEFQISDAAIAEGVSAAAWPGRLQRIRNGAIGPTLPGDPEVWFDGGHNAAAARALGITLDDWQALDPRPLFVIVGMIATKQARHLIRPLARRAQAMATVPIVSSAVSQPPSKLADIVASCGTPVVAVESVEAALKAISTAQPPFSASDRAPRILITGSLYLAAEVLNAT